MSKHEKDNVLCTHRDGLIFIIVQRVGRFSYMYTV